MGIDHVLDRVGDDVARGQRIEHAIVAHGNAVVDGNGVELGCVAPQSFDFLLHDLSCFVQVGVTGHKLGEGINYGNDRLAKLLTFHAVGDPQGAGSGHAPSFGADGTT